MKIIELKDVFFEYDREEGPVLKGFSLDVDAGDAVILQGDNGSGKTTVLRVVNGLSFPGQGSYLFKGEAVTRILTPCCSTPRSTTRSPSDPGRWALRMKRWTGERRTCWGFSSSGTSGTGYPIT